MGLFVLLAVQEYVDGGMLVLLIQTDIVYRASIHFRTICFSPS